MGSVVSQDPLVWAVHSASLHKQVLSPITDLLDKGTPTTVDHEDVRSLPGLHALFAVLFAFWKSAARVDVRVAQVGIRVIDILGNGAAVRRHSKERFTMVVTLLLEQRVRDLSF